MKKSILKLLSCGMVITLLLVGFAACAPDDEDVKEKEVVVADDNFNKEGLPIVNEVVTFDMVGIKQATWPDDLTEMAVVKKYAEETNVHFNYQLYTSEAWNAQKPLIASSKDLPDAFGVGNPLTDQDVMDFSSQGIIIPLRELAEEYMPRFNEIMEETPAYYKSFMSVDGDFYGFPTHYDIDWGNRGDILHYNKEWIIELRPDWKIAQGITSEYLDEDITIDEFYDLMVDMKATYPNAISFTANNVYPHDNNLYLFYYAFDNMDNNKYITLVDGKVEATVLQDSWRDATEYVSKLYTEGLIDIEIFTHNNDIWRAKLMEEESIVGVSNMWSGLIAVPDYTDMTDYRYKNFIPGKPLVGPNGRQMWSKSADGVAIKSSFSITTACENPEILARYQDYLYDPLLSLESSYGKLGENLIQEDGGRFSQVFNAETTIENTTLNTMFITTKAMNSQINYAPATEMPQEVSRHVIKPYQEDGRTYPAFTISDDDNRRISILQTDLKKFIDGKRAEFIVNGGVMEGWDSFKDELMKIGIEEYIEIMQRNYDRYLEM